MNRTVRSSDVFDRKLGALFEEFAGQEQELRERYKKVIKSLVDGSLGKAKKHKGIGYTGSIPLIADYIIVFAIPGTYLEGLDYVDISETDRIDLLDIERTSK